jgi:hypothetical protein
MVCLQHAGGKKCRRAAVGRQGMLRTKLWCVLLLLVAAVEHQQSCGFPCALTFVCSIGAGNV